MESQSPPPRDPVAGLAGQIRERLVAHRPVPDSLFDELLSPSPRLLSSRYWTKVEVAQTASRWLTEAGALRLLDVGSGVGKFCAIAALTSSHRVWGVELRGGLALESRQLAQRLGAEVVILDGTLEAVDPRRFDSFYFFNPFAEHLFELADQYDDRFPGSVDGFLRDVKLVERWLRAAPLGSAMATYNGLGGRIPLSWKLEKSMELGGDELRLWIKRGADGDSTDAHIEVNDEEFLASRLPALIAAGDPRLQENSLLYRLLTREPA